MIRPNMKTYDYFTYGVEDAYGQKALSAKPTGTVKMSVFVSSQAVQDNINYKDCQYVGFTYEPVNDTYVIKYGSEMLKVLFVNTQGRYTQVYMSKV